VWVSISVPSARTMARAINQTPDPFLQAEVSRYIDLKKFMTYIGIENFFAEEDECWATLASTTPCVPV
jgi:hypothetical protein